VSSFPFSFLNKMNNVIAIFVYTVIVIFMSKKSKNQLPHIAPPTPLLSHLETLGLSYLLILEENQLTYIVVSLCFQIT